MFTVCLYYNFFISCCFSLCQLKCFWTFFCARISPLHWHLGFTFHVKLTDLKEQNLWSISQEIMTLRLLVSYDVKILISKQMSNFSLTFCIGNRPLFSIWKNVSYKSINRYYKLVRLISLACKLFNMSLITM